MSILPSELTLSLLCQAMQVWGKTYKYLCMSGSVKKMVNFPSSHKKTPLLKKNKDYLLIKYSFVANMTIKKKLIKGDQFRAARIITKYFHVPINTCFKFSIQDM